MTIYYNNRFRASQQCYTALATSGGTVFTNLAYGLTYPFTPTSVVNDAIYFTTDAGQFTGIEFQSNYFIGLASTSHTLVWEYYNGSAWVELPDIVDGTNGLKNYGIVTWTKPSDEVFYPLVYSTQTHRLIWIRARLTAVNNITNTMTFHSGHAVARRYSIVIEGESVTPASLYTGAVSAGYPDMVLFDGDRKYTFPYGFFIDSASTITITGQSLQFGTPEVPTFNFGFNDYNYAAKWVINADAVYKASNLSSQIEFYTSNMSQGTFTFGSLVAGSEINNVMFTMYTNSATKTYRNKYRMQYFGANGVGSQNFNIIFNCTVYNRYYGNYERVSMPDVQYLLSDANAVYKNIYFRNWVRVDPTYYPILEDSTFDIKNSDGTWMGIGVASGTSVYHGYFEVIGCEFPNNNKYTPVSYFQGYASYDYHLRQVYSNRFNLQVVDEDGNPIEDAKIELTDSYGQNSLYQPTTMYINALTTDSATTITVNSSAGFTIGKYYRIAAEVMKVTGKPSGTTINVERGQLNTRKRHYVGANAYVKFEELNDYLMTDSNGDMSECKVMETCFYRNGTSATITYNYFTPFTITITKNGYEPYVGVLPLTEKTTTIISMQKPNVYLYEDLNVDITEDEIDVRIGS